MNKAKDYIKQVQNGKITVSSWVELAIERHQKDLTDAGKRGYIFNEALANQWVGFAEICNLFEDEWAGKKLVLEPWQAFYMYSSMGWRKTNGARRFRRCFMKVARKNAKSTIEAIRLLGHIFLDDLKGAQGYCLANKEDQARIVLNMAGQIAKITPSLNKLLEFYETRGTINRILYRKNNSFLAAHGSDSTKQDGLRPTWVSWDEPHEAKDDKQLNVMESGMGSNRMPGPMTDIISTEGFYQAGPFVEIDNYCKSILKGTIIDDSIYGLLFEQDHEDEWKEPTTWDKSNPNLDVSVFSDYLKERYTEAVNLGGTKEVDFKTKNLNIRCNASDVWINDEVWNTRTIDIKEGDLVGKPCFVGLDLAKKLDINAMALFFPDVSKNEKGMVSHAVLMYFWIPKEKKNKDSDHVDYYRWISLGFIKELGEYSIDFRDLGPEIGEILKDYEVKNVGFDRRYAHDGTIRDLQDEGFECAEVIQNCAYLHLPTIELEKMAIEGTLEHFDNPVLRWMVSNVELYTDTGGSVRPDKRNSKGKIDGAAALVNAIFVWMASKEEEQQEAKIEIW